MRDVAHDIAQKGFTFLPDFVGINKELKKIFKQKKTKSGYVKDIVLGDFIFQSLEIKKLIKSIKEKIPANINYDFSSFYCIHRLIDSSNKNVETFLSHYDSYFLTIVFPINVDSSWGGELYLLPLNRKRPTNFLNDFLGKLQTLFLRKKSKVLKKIEEKEALVIDFQDSIPVSFLGDTCMHGNMPFNNTKFLNGTRSTVLFHIGRPKFFTIGKINEFLRSR